LRAYVDGFAARSGIRVAVVIDPELQRLGNDIELGIFRIVQESLTNIHRHSHSQTASILLSREAADVRLEIRDQGTGIPPDVLIRTERGTAGVGIAGMRERVRLLGGRFEINSDSRGTAIRIVLPVAKDVFSSEPLAVSA
jgi:signal transduction histidine kinase